MKPANRDPLLDLLDSATPQANSERRAALEDRLVAQLYTQPTPRSRLMLPVTLVATLLVVFVGVLALMSGSQFYPAAISPMMPTQVPTNAMMVLSTQTPQNPSPTPAPVGIIFPEYSLYFVRDHTLVSVQEEVIPLVGQRINLYFRTDLVESPRHVFTSSAVLLAEHVLVTDYLEHAGEYILEIPNDVLPYVRWLLQNNAALVYTLDLPLEATEVVP